MESPEKIGELFNWLMTLGKEVEWVEYKHNNHDPEMIGEYISALSNAAAHSGKPFAFIIWGIEDETLNLLGTNFDPDKEKVGNENLENWLIRKCNPRPQIRFYLHTREGKRFIILRIPASRGIPTSFNGDEFTRIGSYKQKLKDYPEWEKKLWDVILQKSFETDIAVSHLDIDEILELLDVNSYFSLLGETRSQSKEFILKRFCAEGFVVENSGKFDITNYGALLLARDLSLFNRIGRKKLRIIFYKGTGKYETIKEKIISSGYASSFQLIIDYLNDQLPRNEEINRAARVSVPLCPELSVRELIANALIHQDFSIIGSGPMVEVYSNRIEVSNPGTPLIEIDRLIDQPPRSRNEKIAAFMRRINYCEERGSGIDKVINQAEIYQLPPPDFRLAGDNMIAVLFAPRGLNQMDQAEKIRACYQHACLRYVSGEKATNTSVRERFGISDQNYPTASKIISDSSAPDRLS